jgi:hypothetical protein
LRRRSGRIGPGAARIALRVALLAPLVSGTLLRPAHAGAPGVWSNFVPVGGGQAAYDARRHRLIRPDGFGHTWALDLDTDSSWVEIATNGGSLVGLPVTLYDPVGDRVLNGSSALDLAGPSEWRSLAAAPDPVAGLPSSSEFGPAVYDSQRNRMLLFAACGLPETEVWALTLTPPVHWTLLSRGGGPIPRCSPLLAYDSIRDRLILHAGSTSNSCDLADTWTLPLADSPPRWHQLATVGPFPDCAFRTVAVFDAQNDRMVVAPSRLTNGGFQAFSALDLSAPEPEWTRLPVTFAPNGFAINVDYPAICLDTHRHRLVGFGGGETGRGLGTFAVALDSPYVCTRLGDPEPPPTTALLASVLDPATGNIVGVGVGAHFTFDRAAGGKWRRRSAPNPPALGATPVSIVDRLGRIVALGGANGVARVFTIPADGSQTWTELQTTGAPPGFLDGITAVYDSRRNRMLVYGGLDPDVHALDLDSKVWERLAITGALPRGRAGHSAVYDSLRDQMVIMLGGNGNPFQQISYFDVWGLTLADPPSWYALDPTGTPPPSLGRAAVWDRIHDRVIVVGKPPRSEFNGVGVRIDALTLADGAWHELMSTRSPDGPVLCGLDTPHDALEALVATPVRDDAMVVAWEFAFGPTRVAAMDCGTPIVLGPAQSLTLSSSITKPDALDQTADYVLTSERAWPLFPFHGSVLLDGGQQSQLQLAVPVPDSAAPGPNHITIEVMLRGTGEHLSCVQLVTRLAPVLPPTSLAVRALAGNPAANGWTLALDLPAAGRAEVELFDLTGRRLESVRVDASAAGTQSVTLGRGSTRRAGVYAARVRFRGAERTLRLIALR